VQRTGLGRATAVSQLSLARAKPAAAALHDPATVRNFRGRSTSRVSRAMAWLRGRPKQHDHTRNLSAQYFPVVCGS